MKNLGGTGYMERTLFFSVREGRGGEFNSLTVYANLNKNLSVISIIYSCQVVIHPKNSTISRHVNNIKITTKTQSNVLR